jgi:hypothetical protein
MSTQNGNTYATLPRNPIKEPMVDKPWIEGLPVITTGHLPQALADDLAFLTTGIVLAEVPGDGFFIKIPDGEEMADPADPPTEYPEINTLLVYLAARGYHYARISPMGDEYEDLPSFDW